MNMAIHKNQNGPDGKLFEGLIKRLVGNLQLYKQYFYDTDQKHHAV